MSEWDEVLKRGAKKSTLRARCHMLRSLNIYLHLYNPGCMHAYTPYCKTPALCKGFDNVCISHSFPISPSFLGISSGFLPFILLSSLISSSLCCSSFDTCSFDLKPVPNQRRIPVQPISNQCNFPSHSTSKRSHTMSTYHISIEYGKDLLCTQNGQSTCALFALPHALHLFNAVTSLRCFPAAICRCRFFMCEVFFLGTALRIPSQRSENSEGIGRSAAGTGIASVADARRRWRRGSCLAIGCVDAGKSCARTMGRKAQRKVEDGARIAAIANELSI